MRRYLLPAAVALGAVAATHLGSWAAGAHTRVLDARSAWSWSHFAATAAFAAGAAVCAVNAVRTAGMPRRRWWVIAGVVFAILFADGATRAHDHLAHWALVLLPMLVVLGGALLLATAGDAVAPAVVAGLALLATSFVVHATGPHLVKAAGWPPDGFAYQVKVALKEGLELAGWVVVLIALLTVAGRQGLRQTTTRRRVTSSSMS
jgi:hypothetical protein